MMYVEKNDIKQISVIAKNEIRKFIRGKRFLIYVILAAAVFSMITFLPFAFEKDPWASMTGFLSTHLSFISLLVILAATLFTSSTYVSEFEERTALILFTRPVKKTTIFIGKSIGCFLMGAVVLIGYYAAISVAYIFFDDAPSASQFLASLGGLMLCLFAASGVAAVFSVIMKKSGTAAIMTFVTMLLLISIISGVIYVATGEMPWYMLDQAMSIVFACIPDVAAIVGLTDFDIVNGVSALVVWGAVSTFLAWLIFTRKEM
jgi:ABC-2 type transport system permease protein